jgi:hypothetical protein
MAGAAVLGSFAAALAGGRGGCRQIRDLHAAGNRRREVFMALSTSLLSRRASAQQSGCSGFAVHASSVTARAAGKDGVSRNRHDRSSAIAERGGEKG